MGDPEISIGSGKTQITLRGREAIRAAGWPLRFLLFAYAIALLSIPSAFGAVYWLLKWWVS